jgi:hypothetical protein
MKKQVIWKGYRGPPLNLGPGGAGGGRWYPTLITLSDGNIIAMCGHPLIGSLVDPTNPVYYDERHNNTIPECYDPANPNQWTPVGQTLPTGPHPWGIALGADGAHDYAPFYPRLHIVPQTGEVFIVQPLYSRLVMLSGPQCTDPTICVLQIQMTPILRIA